MDDRTHDERCIPGVIDCALRILAPDDPNTRLTLIHMDFSAFDDDINVKDADQGLWDAEPMVYKELGLEDPINLESKTDILVGGAPAVKRIFSELLLKNNKVIGTLYVERVLIVYQKQTFHFYLNTTVKSKFAGYQELMEQIIETFVFK